jgi:hypothetical protein
VRAQSHRLGSKTRTLESKTLRPEVGDCCIDGLCRSVYLSWWQYHAQPKRRFALRETSRRSLYKRFGAARKFIFR